MFTRYRKIRLKWWSVLYKRSKKDEQICYNFWTFFKNLRKFFVDNLNRVWITNKEKISRLTKTCSKHCFPIFSLFITSIRMKLKRKVTLTYKHDQTDACIQLCKPIVLTVLQGWVFGLIQLRCFVQSILECKHFITIYFYLVLYIM